LPTAVQSLLIPLNTIILYSAGIPEVPEPPDGDYVLIIGNQMNGFTFSQLAQFVEGLDLDLRTLTVPHYEERGQQALTGG